MIVSSTAPHINAATAIPATAPAPHQIAISTTHMVRFSNRITFLASYQRKM